MADKGKKRERLSGSQYLNKRLSREANLMKQKNCLLKFITTNQSEKYNQNENQNIGKDFIEDQNIGMQDERAEENCNDREDNDGTENNEEQDFGMQDEKAEENCNDKEDNDGTKNNDGQDISMEDIGGSKKKSIVGIVLEL